MRIEILDSDEKDLINGFKFYERQSTGLGITFSTLFSQTQSGSISMPVFTFSISGITGFYPNDSPMPFTIECKRTSFGSMRFWIVARIPRGFEIDLPDL
jgi:hypothetical protein